MNHAYEGRKFMSRDQLAQLASAPNDPFALATTMALQYQQQVRASDQPPAPQGTVLQQKLQEFQQASGPAQGGLPAVGQNQVAMQQVAQQDPMFGAGIAAAPENISPEQAAATGGIVALAHGGRVGYYNGGEAEFSDNQYGGKEQAAERDDAVATDRALKEGVSLDTYLSDKGAGDVLSEMPMIVGNKMVEYGGKPDIYKSDAIKRFKNTAGQESAPIVATPTSMRYSNTAGQLEAPTGTPIPTKPLSATDTTGQGWTDTPENMGIGALTKGVGDAFPSEYSKPKILPTDTEVHKPTRGSSARINATQNKDEETYPDVSAYTSSEDALKNIMALRGESPDMSEQISMAKEMVGNAGRDKMISALLSGIGGSMSAGGIGAGLVKGAETYASGAKGEQEARRGLMALQMGEKTAKAGDRSKAAELYIAQQAAQAAAASKAFSDRGLQAAKSGDNQALAGINNDAEAARALAKHEWEVRGEVTYETKQKLITSALTYAKGLGMNVADTNAFIRQQFSYLGGISDADVASALDGGAKKAVAPELGFEFIRNPK